MTISRHTHFLVSYFRQISPALLLVVGIAVAYVYFMQFVDHRLSWVPYLVLLLAFFKTLLMGRLFICQTIFTPCQLMPHAKHVTQRRLQAMQQLRQPCQ